MSETSNISWTDATWNPWNRVPADLLLREWPAAAVLPLSNRGAQRA